ncbi:MAG: hypothetical protein ABL977_14445, partial [Candidatus Eisenbacteria bacterium]
MSLRSRSTLPSVARIATALAGLLALLALPLRARAESGAFVVRALGDTIAIERFERHGERVSGTLLFRLARLRFDYA